MKISRITIDNLEKQEPSKVPPYFEDICPICNTKASTGCRCAMSNGISNDRGCFNGHKWYWDNGKVVIGSHHKLK